MCSTKMCLINLHVTSIEKAVHSIVINRIILQWNPDYTTMRGPCKTCIVQVSDNQKTNISNDAHYCPKNGYRPPIYIRVCCEPALLYCFKAKKAEVLSKKIWCSFITSETVVD